MEEPHMRGSSPAAFVIIVTRVSQSARRRGSDTPSRNPVTLPEVGTVLAGATFDVFAARVTAMDPSKRSIGAPGLLGGVARRRLHFLDLLRVALGVRALEQDALVGVRLADRQV